MKKIRKTEVLVEKMDVKSEEFKEFQKILLKKSKERTKEQNDLIDQMALKFKMEDSKKK